MEPINEQAKEKLAELSKSPLNRLIVVSLLGPVGMFLLIVKKMISKLEFAGLFCMWFSVIWCRYLTGVSFPSTYYEIFIIGMMGYGGVILNPIKSESNIAAEIFASVIMFLAAITGYFELLGVRNTKGLVSPIDLFVIGIGYFGYLLSSYLAWKKRPDVP